jgi:small-conductance mechanosensitive channel
VRAALIFVGWIAVIATGPGQLLQPGVVLAAAADTNAASGSGLSAAALEARLAEARANLAAALGDAMATNAPVGVSPQDIWVRRAALQRLVRIYEQQLSSAAELEAARTRNAEIVREAQSWTRFAEPLPYSILLTDRLREEVQTERLKIISGEAAASLLEQIIEENRKSLAQAEEKIRQLNEQLEGANDPALAARLSWQRELERVRSQMAAGTVAVLEQERLMGRERTVGSRSRIGLLQRQIIIAEAGAIFTQADLDQVKSQLEREREQLERELAEAQARRLTAFQALEAAREELRLAKTRPDSLPAAIARVTELIAAREAQLDAADTATRVLRLILEGGNMEQAMWEMRFAAYGTRNVETLRDSRRRLSVVIQRLDLWRNRERQLLDVSSSQVQLQQTRVNSLAPDSELLPLARERLAALGERDRLLLRFVRTIEHMERLTQRWDEGLRGAKGRLPFAGRVQDLFSDTRSFIGKLWTFELFTAEDTITVDGQKITGIRSITIGKIVLAVFILVAGIWITGLISRIVEPIIVRRLKIEANQATLIRRWIRAAMIACLVLFSLVSVKIPLTVFAFAGGALAIGLGFGMQTMLKNLVSGLIILFERPFRVGDVLDVSGQKGTVTSVGLRASVLQLWDGTETLIPNSALLENNLTNWTYSNRKVRFSVSVGVAYGSDPRRVIQLLEEVAGRHGLVESDPKPQVFFTEFGDSTLTFELRFWVDVAKANAAQVSSDLRLMIAGSFAEHGIVIDFPQRDIHLHSARPIQVQMVSGAAGLTGDGAKPNRTEAGDKPGSKPGTQP